jgi:hypothetical protein
VAAKVRPGKLAKKVSMEIQIRVSGDQVRFIYSDDLKGFMEHGEAKTARASHVEPSGNMWVADLSPVNGPKLGPFTKRAEALTAEVMWLYQNNIPIPFES